jgi:opacity protein-like surface antigen
MTPKATRLFLVFVLLLQFFTQPEVYAQGVSFSYLIPKNGYLSAPISPFSIRGVGIGKTVGIETGFTLYSMPGLAMKDLPFASDKPLTGPNWTILIPIEMTLSTKMGKMGFKLMAGGFSLVPLSTRINEGNMDRALAKYEQWDVATSNFKMKTHLGFGWMAGGELQYRINRKLAITTEIQYLKGASKSTIKGRYAGGTIGQNIQEKDINFQNAKTSLEGLEISLGVKLGGK